MSAITPKISDRRLGEEEWEEEEEEEEKIEGGRGNAAPSITKYQQMSPASDFGEAPLS